MGFISTESWQGEDGRFFLETTRLPHEPFTPDQKGYINNLPFEFADAGAVEITWRNHWAAGEPTECLVAIRGINDERFEQIREGLSDVLHREEGEASQPDHVYEVNRIDPSLHLCGKCGRALSAHKCDRPLWAATLRN